MTTRGQINSNFYQIVDVDVDGNPTQVKPAYVPAVDHANTANYANFAGNAFSVTGSNVVGTVANATYATDAGHATVSDSANSVSLGNVVGAGNIASINLNGNSQQVLSGIGTWVEQTGGGGTPGGSNTQVQYNDGVGFAGSVNLTFDVTTGILTASKISGNGSLLTNLTGANVTGTVANATYATSAGSASTATDASHATVADSANSVAGANVTGIVGNATHANISDVANSVSVANVVGIGNIATVNLSGNGAQTLLGNGIWGALPNTATANYANFAGNVTIAAQPNITSLGNLTSMSLNNTVTPITANVGEMFCDTNEHTVTIGMENGVQQQVGLESYIYVKASSPITDGQVVMFTGANGDNVLAAPADVTSVGFNTDYVIGVATQSIATNSFGYITVTGKVHGLNTLGFTVGDILWLSTTTPGALTNVQPTDPAFQIQVAAVTKVSGGDGHIQVRVTPYWALSKLTDVTLTSPTTGQALIYNGSNVWINGNPQQANVANTANSVAGANVSGQVANALVAGTVYTNSQPNITSVGTLTGLTSNGVVDFTNTSNVSLGTLSNVHISGGTANYVLSTNGSGTLGWTDPGSFSTSAAGANTEVQFNNNGLFGASNAFTFTNISRTADLNIGTLGAIFPGNTSTYSNAILRLSATSSGAVDNQTVFTKPTTLLDGAPLNIFDAFGFTYEGNGTGDFTLANVATANLGDVSSVKITGGVATYILSTDGTGNLEWVAQASGGSPAGNIYNVQYNSGSGGFAAQDNFNFYPFDSGNNTPSIIELGVIANTPGTGQPWSGGQLTLLADSGNGIIRKTKENGILIQDNSSAFDTIVTITANTISLGSNANINITGGSSGQVLSTDGTGNLSWTTAGGGSSTTDFTPSFLLGGM